MDAYWMRDTWGDSRENDRRWNIGSRNPLTIIITSAVLFIGVAVVFAVGYLFPSLQWLTITVACLVLIGVTFAMRQFMGTAWAYWYTVPVAAVVLLGSVMLAEDVALAQVGELTEVVVVDHQVEQKTVHTTHTPRSYEVYTHTYTLERTDGTPVAEPMYYHGKDGFDDFDEGDTITVLIDPEETAPTKPAENIDFGADIGILVTGVVSSGIVFLICLIVVVLRWMRSPSPQMIH